MNTESKKDDDSVHRRVHLQAIMSNPEDATCPKCGRFEDYCEDTCAEGSSENVERLVQHLDSAHAELVEARKIAALCEHDSCFSIGEAIDCIEAAFAWLVYQPIDVMNTKPTDPNSPPTNCSTMKVIRYRVMGSLDVLQTQVPTNWPDDAVAEVCAFRGGLNPGDIFELIAESDGVYNLIATRGAV